MSLSFPSLVLPARGPPAPRGAASVAEKVLVLDDSRAQRALLTTLLRRWGHPVVTAANPSQALDLLQDPTLTLVISDWMMPEMDGPEFCRRARRMSRDSYAYILLLTSKSDTGAIAQGLDAGADDFLTKPVNPHELRARIHAGERIVAMQRELVAKNQMVTAAYSEISTLYGALDRDLAEAKKLQASLVPQGTRCFTGGTAAFCLRPSGRVGGDLVGYFPVSDQEIGLFALDVSGHGVTSALVTARLAGLLTAASPDQNIALARTQAGFAALPPDQVADRLNHLMFDVVKTDLYFTLCLALVALDTGACQLVQAGHPHPALLRPDGTVRFLGSGGMPIGLWPGATYASFDLTLRPGDRLLLYSDGLTECPNPDGAPLDETGLAALLATQQVLRGTAFLEGVIDRLQSYAGQSELPDDLSALVFEFSGRASG